MGSTRIDSAEDRRGNYRYWTLYAANHRTVADGANSGDLSSAKSRFAALRKAESVDRANLFGRKSSLVRDFFVPDSSPPADNSAPAAPG
jgi:hypothetical protein